MGRIRKLVVVEIVDRFLVSLKSSSSRATQIWYNNYLRKFADRYGGVPVGELTPSMVYRWIADRHGKHSPSTQHGAARAVVRMLNWAVAERIIADTPLRGFRKPAPSRRETSLTSAQYAKCLRHANPTMKVVVKFLWHTGCRPQELRAIRAEWIEGRKIVLPLKASKGHKKRRTIYLDDMAARIVASRQGQVEGALFRNGRRGEWTKDAMTLAFRRLAANAGIPGLCAYAFRHAFITRLLENGVDVATVAAIAGNSPRMVLEAYNHVGNDEARLLSMLG